MTLFRALVPSWRFFDELGSVSRLYYRTGESADALGAWRKCLIPEKRTLGALFLNPAGNFHLAANTLVDRLNDDLEASQKADAGPIEEAVSYRLVLNLIRHQMRLHSSVSPVSFQFKLTQLDQDETSPQESDVLLSVVYES